MKATSPELSDKIVEAYLDRYPEFTKRYFSTRYSLDAFSWFSSQTRSVKSSMEVMSSKSHTSESVKSSQVLKPLRESASMMSTEKVLQIFGGEGEGSKSLVRNRINFDNLNEKDLFMELIRDISNELDVQRLSHKILVNVGILTKADRCSLFLAQGSKDNRILVSKLFDVTSETSFEESLRAKDDAIVVPFGVGIAGHTAKTGDTINIRNAYQDPRFNSAIDKQTGYKTHSVVCMPIKNHDGQVIGVAQVINKKCGDHEFTEKDVEVVKTYLTFCGIGLTNALLFELSVMEYKRNQVLLQLAKRIFEEQTCLDKVVHNIMSESQELLHCERCSVFLVDTSIDSNIVFSKSFDLLPEGQREESSPTNAHWSLNNGIAAFAAVTGETINIPDAYKDSRFCEKVKEADRVSGFKTKSILCTPIKRDQKIIGVCQLINKLDGDPFDENDESLFEAFAIFCGIGIHNTNMYEQTCKLLAKQMVAMEVLSYHARAALEDVNRLMQAPVPDSAKFNLHDFAFSDFELSDDETIQASLRMFLGLNILQMFHVPLKTCISWLLSVKKNYRPVIYHNWRHAFNVAQTMFAMLTTGNMKRYFTDLEVFSLLVACLCHDLDHRGTNNTFQSKNLKVSPQQITEDNDGTSEIESPLAQLYGTSTMEHHHFDHCIMILNSDGNNIFSELPPDDYRTAIGYLEHAILSTDLQVYFKKRSEFTQIIESSEPPNWGQNCNNRTVLRAMLMTACDVSAITKPWPIQQTVAKLVASEFFEQGDIERAKLKSEPMPMMDRQKKDDLPKMQVGFIDSICLPIYELMKKVEPDLSPLYDGVLSNRKNWQALAEKNFETVLAEEKEQTPNSIRKHPDTKEEQNNNIVAENELTQQEKAISVPNSKKKTSSRKTTSKTCCLV